jgi:hypothetical protein
MLVSKPKGRHLRPAKPIIYKALPVGGALISEHLPRYDYRDALQIVVTAPLESVYDIVVSLAPGVRDHIASLGTFSLIGERRNSELLLGVIGRPWEATANEVLFETGTFADVMPPNAAKSAWSWIVRPLGSGQTLVVAEWRTLLTDDQAHDAFVRIRTHVADELRREARAALERIKELAELNSPYPAAHLVG